jgi:hypothetical protein
MQVPYVSMNDEKIFKDEIGDMLEVYMDNMIVKSSEERQHGTYLPLEG